MPVPTRHQLDRRNQLQRRQVRGLLLLALAILLFSLLRAGFDHVFTPAGWWRIW
jgi:hypothetical protein